MDSEKSPSNMPPNPSSSDPSILRNMSQATHAWWSARSLPMPAALCLKFHLLSLCVCMVYQVPPLLAPRSPFICW